MILILVIPVASVMTAIEGFVIVCTKIISNDLNECLSFVNPEIFHSRCFLVQCFLSESQKQFGKTTVELSMFKRDRMNGYRSL